ncbi:unnamed protein product, partial [Scytosiphon promiscuus]
ASVHLTGVNISDGTGIVGGAIAAMGSNLTLDTTGFFGNAATVYGGAIYATSSSVVSFVGHNILSNNLAEVDGGAMFVSDSVCSGENLSLFNNTSGGDGGALMITERSNLSWSGEGVFRENRAGGAGGAI